MKDGLATAVEFRTGGQLDHAAGVRRDDDGSTRTIDAFHFLFEQRHRHFVLHDVIDAGRAAAEIGALHLHQFQARDGFKDLPGL